MKTAALLIAACFAGPALAAEAAPAAFRPDAVKGQEKAAVCVSCHTADGSRGVPANPIIQGQHPGYIVKQLAEFKVGKRKNPIMNGMAAPLTEEDMQNLAAFYSDKQAKPGFAKAPTLVSLGERSYRGGIPQRQVPACSGCHSPNGAGVPSQYPRLAGQHGDYAEAQLLAFRAGVRNNSVQMMTIASKLNDAEIKAVSDYMTGLR